MYTMIISLLLTCPLCSPSLATPTISVGTPDARVELRSADKPWPGDLESRRMVCAVLVAAQSVKESTVDAQERTATEDEKKAFLDSHGGDCYVFPEDRRRPIRERTALPVHWIRRELTPYVEGMTGRNEYFTFQLGVFAARKDLRNTHVIFDDLLDKNGYRIPASRLAWFTTDSNASSGKPLHKELHTSAGSILPLWIGVDIPAGIHPGSYAGSIEVRSDGVREEVLLLRLIVSDTLFIDRGDGEPWRHSRLRFRNPGHEPDGTRPEGGLLPMRGLIFGIRNGHALPGDDVISDPCAARRDGARPGMAKRSPSNPAAGRCRSMNAHTGSTAPRG